MLMRTLFDVSEALLRGQSCELADYNLGRKFGRHQRAASSYSVSTWGPGVMLVDGPS